MNLNLNLLLVDVYPLFGYGIKSVLESKDNIESVNILYIQSKDFSLLNKLQSEIIVINIEHYNIRECIIFLQNLKSSAFSLTTKIAVIIKNGLFQVYFNELVCLNVKGFMTTTTDADGIAEMFYLIQNDQMVISRELSRNMNTTSNKNLTSKEIQILKLIYNEKTNKEISKILNYSVSTVEYYLTMIFHKLSVKTRVGAVREASNLGILPNY
ncbi:response regulator transcription factor [Bacillus sp. C28GYM-DRY-1]|uniref:response regulator transcription factor n=1 Tax=Bacillus sp. C28GYM-DRY-1 TaxID=3062686 RepID=UPI002674D494|nr:LuxR C-terminal-related transcriptional regulator [Bacillus sp. C28GYM-DRY-1]MDO3661785.1 LuxR C-terminal-related transcriptional regulator [Bacillus sp. C28GYM-DRY-1]